MRTVTIYVTPQMKRRLRWLAAAASKREGNEGRIITADEIAERLLEGVMEARFPVLKKAEESMERVEKRVIEDLAGKSAGDTPAATGEAGRTHL